MEVCIYTSKGSSADVGMCLSLLEMTSRGFFFLHV